MVDPADDMSQSLCDDREDDVSMMDAMAADTQHRTSFYMEVQVFMRALSSNLNSWFACLVFVSCYCHISSSAS